MLESKKSGELANTPERTRLSLAPRKGVQTFIKKTKYVSRGVVARITKYPAVFHLVEERAYGAHPKRVTIALG